jgi:hypothetical protein
MSSIQTAARALAKKVKQGAYTDEDVQAVVKAVFECDNVNTEKCNYFRERADNLTEEGRLEVDEEAVVSLSEDGGAYVQAWLWVEDEDGVLIDDEEDE